MVGVRDKLGGLERQKRLRSRQSWLSYAVVVLLVLGIFFRFVNIDRKVYWVDEVYTSLRSSGHTQRELVRQIFNGQEVTVADLQAYQHLSPDKDWGDTLQALKGNAEHAPLYFLLLRFWMQAFGSSVATVRTLSALFSLLAFPCLYWLCRELFAAPAVKWVAVSLFAISPLHVLYAQEARQYSLWTVMVLLSSATLLWAMRTKTRRSWIAYGVAVALGLYTHLLFALVAIAHALYVLVIEKLRPTRTVLRYLLASGLGALAFMPWVVVVATSMRQIQTTTDFLTRKQSLSRLIDGWFLDINRVFLDLQLGSFNFVLVLVVAIALFALCRHAPRRTWLMVVALMGVNFFALAVPDLALGGMRSMQVRYLIPFYLGIQLALAYGFAYYAVRVGAWWQKLCRVVLVGMIVAGIISCVNSAQAEVWWNKSLPKSSHYPRAADIVNKADRPLLISDSNPIGMLSFSYLTDSDVRFRLVTQPGALKPFDDVGTVYALTPSNQLKARLKNRLNYQMVPVLKKDGKPYLWQLQKSQEE
ncbi:glycosyltransferase family 39 protein [Oculatella sp. LEGE 06141]|uniref:glycosyltransferase family 39 protein n=1 Tax=Oculatella sp. LEGE 06141 TaxID=1828648 RepID=UPI0018812434|nr:glycosyltransferase family 39 protein [Oculatella sp. LEGE 06141]MBE9177770.1 glycosyltransferase family 39 protein [Oculatella sp. LEGE 06141]